MNRAFNFCAGPAALPTEVLEQARDELLDWGGRGHSVMECSHRSPDFMKMAATAEADLRELLAIPDNYKVLFLQGGATLQFAMAPLNLMGKVAKADYINTGHWSAKAISEARRFGEINIAASSEARNFTFAPSQDNWNLSPDAAYVHYTPNETIGGVEFPFIPDTGNVPLVADMSSTILSRPLDVSRFGVIYAGAQKNIGPAGLTLVIVRDDLLDQTMGQCPTLMSYANHAERDSMLNTPPTLAWYLAGLVFKWLRRQGGVVAMAEVNQRKADKLYRAIDESSFFNNAVDSASRSWMNIPFTLADSELDTVFLTESKAAGLFNLKGHKAVGGMRASIYNAVPEIAVDALVAFMSDFEHRYG